MCGINGIINFRAPIDKSSAIIQSMNDAIKHRGPDGEGTYISKNKHIIFGHRRLCIVDKDGGAQPMVVHDEGYEYVLTFNGEIYNYLELRILLKEKGYQFKTDSDTEVLLAAYRAWGKNCLSRFNGDFAFVLYDEKKNSVFLARDRVGVKPFYYTLLDDGSLVFSSEPKSILVHPQFKKEPDHETIADFFLTMTTFTDGCPQLHRSFFKRLYALEPGTYAFFDRNGLQVNRYWNIPLPPQRTFQDIIPELHDCLTQSTRMRIPAEVSFGTSLSGGIDSSIITSIAADSMQKPLISSTIMFEGSAANPDFEHAQIVAKQKKLKFLACMLTPQKLVEDIDAMIWAMDEPHDTVRQLGLFANYRHLHNAGCTVVLVGEGADEFHLGYYYTSPGFYRDLGLIKDSESFRAAWRRRLPFVMRYFTEEFLHTVDFEKIIDVNVTLYYDACTSSNSIDKMRYFYTKKFLKYRLDANDRCSMAHSVEARVPFCDHNVIEISLAVPFALHVTENTEKYALRQAFKEYLPTEIFERRKYPLPESTDTKIYQLIAGLIDTEIQSAPSRVWTIFNREAIQTLNESFKKIITGIECGVPNNLTQEIPLSNDVQLRLKHVFSVLTFLRWFDMYFGEQR